MMSHVLRFFTHITKSVVFMFGLLLLAACSSTGSAAVTLDTLPSGDAAHGAELFTQAVNGAPACSTCHTTDDTTVVGPGMLGYSERAANRESGKSAEAYTLESILHPATYLVPDFGNVMYNNYAAALKPQDIADLMAYLLSL